MLFKTIEKRTKTNHIKLMPIDLFNKEIEFEGYSKIPDNPEVKSVINLIADLVSNMTIGIYENDKIGDKRIKNKTSRKIDIEPNDFLTRKEYIHLVVSTMLIEGNQITIPEYNENHELINLKPVDPTSVSFKLFDSGISQDYRILIDKKEYHPTEVLHFRYNVRKDNPFIGESKIKILKPILDNLGQSTKTKKTYMNSKYQPPIIISVDSTAEELSSKSGRQKILNDFIETSEKGEPFIIPSSMMQVESVKPLTLNDLAINENIELDKRTIASIFGVPNFVVGSGKYDQKEFNNFINTTILSIAKTIEQELTKKILIKNNQYIKFNVHSLFQYSIREKTEMAKSMLSLGIINGDEARDILGYSPIGQKEFMMLENYIPKDKLGKQTKLKGGEEDK